jgi:hypothetical protein
MVFHSNNNSSIKGTSKVTKNSCTVLGLTLLSLGLAVAQQAISQSDDALVPAERSAAAVVDSSWEVPRFSWGDPNLEGTFTSRDMSGIPMARPGQFGTRDTLNAEEYRQRAAGGSGGLGSLRGGDEFEGEARLQLSALDSSEVGTRVFGYTSYIIDPADGRMPALTSEGEQRQATNRRGQAAGPFFTTEDFSYYDRCITRGVTGSIMPSLYGDAMRIVQSPTEVAITYEMLHETRIIPLGEGSFPDSVIQQYMGASIGHFEGDTLVIETRNLTDKLRVGRMPHSEDAVLTERITRIDPDMINYSVTVDDPRTFVSPWTFRMTLTTQPDYEVLEYSCHEGNFFIATALRAEKNYQESVAQALARGEAIPERNVAGGGSDIYLAPSSAEAVDINADQ